MSENEVMCSNCGTLNKKDSIYCVDCGVLLKTAMSDMLTTTPPTKKESKSSYKEFKFPYKVLIYFGIVVVVNFILSLLILMGFALGANSYFAVFFGVFLLSMIIVGVFWGAAKAGSSDAVEAIGVCGGIVIASIVIALAIPIYIFTTLAPIVGAIAAQIGEAISNALNNFFSSLFEDIEIPGFEPFLFIGLFIVLSIFIVYRYHLVAKRK